MSQVVPSRLMTHTACLCFLSAPRIATSLGCSGSMFASNWRIAAWDRSMVEHWSPHVSEHARGFLISILYQVAIKSMRDRHPWKKRTRDIPPGHRRRTTTASRPTGSETYSRIWYARGISDDIYRI